MAELNGLRSIAADPARVQRSQESQNQQGRQQQQNLQTEFRTQLDERVRQVEEPEEADKIAPEHGDEESELEADAQDQPESEPSDDDPESGPGSDDNPEGLGVHIDLRG